MRAKTGIGIGVWLFASAVAWPAGWTAPSSAAGDYHDRSRVSGEIPASLFTAVETAVGKGGARDFQSRLDAIGQLGSHLAPPDVALLCRYLLDTAKEPGLKPGQAYALKNDILNVLRAQSEPPAEMTPVLVTLHADRSQPLVLRDYALQHMAPWYPRATAGERTELIATLQAASQESGRCYAGTALLALFRLQQENPGTRVDSLTNQVVDLLRDDSANLCARIAAVQLCGLLNLTNTLRDLSSLAASPCQAPTLRLAAAASLRAIGPVSRPPPVQPSPGADGHEAVAWHGGAGVVTGALMAVPPRVANK
jgi:hypothetical protein